MNQVKIGNFIAENRKKKNLTQEQLAEKLGISKNAVSKWERGLNLPDVSLMQDICKLLDITLNEFFAGEKIPDETFKEVADNNLLSALENSVFTLKDKVDFFSRKWEKEHFFELTIWMIVIVFFIIYGFIEDNNIQYLFIIIGFISGIIENNRKMAYIENHAYGKKSNISIDEFRTSIKKLDDFKKIMLRFDNKHDAINYLIKETGLSKQECSRAYDFVMKTDFNTISSNKY